MNTLDIVLLVLVGLGLVHGLFKGLIMEVATLLALILGIWGASRFSYFAAALISEWLEWDESVVHIAALATTFIIIVFVINLVGKIINKIANAIALGLLNRVLGGLFGLVKVVVVLSVIVAVLRYFDMGLPFVSEEMRQESMIYGLVNELSNVFFRWLGEYGSNSPGLKVI